MPDKRPSVKNEKQYEALKDKGMSKERAARIANSPDASSRGGKKSARAATRVRAARQRRRRPRDGRAARRQPARADHTRGAPQGTPRPPIDIPTATTAIDHNPKERPMSEITSPRELFLHELGDILYVERQLADETLPKLIDEVRDDELRQALEGHLAETRDHVKNVEQVFEKLGEEPTSEKCLGFEGLRAEHDKMLEESSAELVDSIDLGAAARTESYEIAAYEVLRRMAKALGEDDAVELLDENLKQEKDALRLVEKIATRVSNESAKAAA